MPAWFDIYGLTVDSPQDEKGIVKVAEQVCQLVRSEVETYGIPLNRIVLGGFSQGGSVAIFTGITASCLRGLGGVMIFSSWLPLAQQIAADNARIHADRDMSILQCHGGADHLVPYPFGSLTNTLLRNNFSFTNIELHKMENLGHACNEEEMLLAQNFLQKLLDS
nr:acyl protein thioesterase 2 [Hymenolepis microstoma]